MTGAETSAFWPTNYVASSQIPPSFSRRLAGPKAFGFRPVPPGKSNYPAGPTPPFSYRPPNTGIFQHSSSPQFSSTGQGPPPGTFLRDQLVIAPHLRPSVGSYSSSPDTGPRPSTFFNPFGVSITKFEYC